MLVKKTGKIRHERILYRHSVCYYLMGILISPFKIQYYTPQTNKSEYLCLCVDEWMGGWMWLCVRTTGGEYKEVFRMCKEKISKAKAHTQLNLVNGAKDNKKLFTNILTVRGGLRTLSILCWIQR